MSRRSSLAAPTRRRTSWGRLVRWWQRRPPVVRDGLFGVLLAVVAFLPPLAHRGTRLGELPSRPIDVVGVLAALAQSLPLAARRRWPLGVLAAGATGFAVQELRGYQSFAGLGMVVALYSAAAHQDRLRRWLVAALSVAYVLLALAEHAAGSPARPQDFAGFYLALAACWLTGSWMRTQRQREIQRRHQAAADMRRAERADIARELHDVVTHHVTAMVVQADAGQILRTEPDRLAANLDAISQTGRQALAELRDLLGVLDPNRSAPAARPPDLDRIAALVEHTRAAGQPVEFATHGQRHAMGAGRELTACRVVQEALTNALKHAAGQPTQVQLDYRPDGVQIAVTTAGPGRDHGIGGTGRGLVGLRERVELFGGTLFAGPIEGGGFAVRARIPVGPPHESLNDAP